MKRVGPYVYIENLPRTTPKHVWKRLYRLARVAQREQEKAITDMILYGTGVVQFSEGQDPKHIPIEQVRFYV